MSAKDFLPRITTALTPPVIRPASALLPGYVQTDLLKKFFGITVDQWFQPAQQENISGFIGERSGVYYQPADDYYLQESTNTRNDYQLEPTIVSVDNNNNTNFVQFYQDLVNSLEFDGALVNNHSRLFAEEYYSWAPPINPDMFINFTNYYWVEIGPQINVITDATNAVLDIIGQVNYTTPGGLVLQSGMKIKFTNDANTEFNLTSYIVENVGSSIQLIDDSLFDGTDGYDVPAYDTTPYDSFAIGGDPNYWTIKRGSQDGNPWSRNNRWFHKDVLGQINQDEVSVLQAHRPIIEFLPNLELRDFARYARPDVKVWSTSDNTLDLVGLPGLTIDGIPVFDGEKILVTGDPDPEKNNRIYEVFGITAFGKVGLELIMDGLDPSGAPVIGEGTKIIDGTINGNYQVYYNGTTFVKGQQKLVDNQQPIYNLYDLHGFRLDSALEYPASTFMGSKIFNYAPDAGAAIDPYLGIPLVFSDFGDIEFDNLLNLQRFSYTSNGVSTGINGYYFYRIYEAPSDIGTDLYNNDWHKSSSLSRQFVLDRFVLVSDITSEGFVEFTRNYTLSITPDVSTVDQINSKVFLNGQMLIDGIDYDIIGDELNLSLSLSLANDDVLEIESWAAVIPGIDGNGYFEIPENLSSNPDNQQITTRSFNQLSQQLISIIANQVGITGHPFGPNNYNDTPRDLGKGNSILNHTASLLRVGLLTGKSQTKLTDSIRYNNREYNAFKGKFLLKIQQFILQGYTSSTPTSVWVQDALNAINVGKTSSFPFAFSAMTAGNNYIPSTASALGVAPVYEPAMYVDETRLTPATVIQGHDGSVYNTYGDFRDQVILELENQIYNNIDPAYKTPEAAREFDLLSLRPGYFRTTDYSRSEWVKITQPGFERWVVKQRIDYTTNNSFDETNPFTWNYSHQKDGHGNNVPGSWRGIYEYFYDTYRPHSHPWELLGFSQQPSWWTSLYGPAPYTRDNLVLWTDLQAGIIRQGTLAGTYSYLARPGLLSIIPVDSAGNLLNPIAAGVVTQPNIVDAQDKWVYGDLGPGEYMWKLNSSYPYDISESMFLAKPAKFVDIFWEARKIARDQGQLYDIDLGRRFTSEDLTVHNEILTDGTRAVVKGISNWISDYLANQNLNLAENFGDLERDLGVKLAYKTGAFIKNQNLRLVSETFGIVPNENLTVQLYKGASIKQPVYSAVIIIWDGSTYRVAGYDSINDSFTIIPGQETGPRTSITAENVTISRYDQGSNTTQEVLYNTALPSREAVYNFLVGYQRWLESQGWQFNDYDNINNQPIDFNVAAQQFLVWSQVPLTIGQSLIVSPISDHIAFGVDHGFVDNIQTYVNGVYGVLDRTGFGIPSSQFDVTRSQSLFEVTIHPNSVQGIYCLRLSIIEYEHIILLDNITKFNDLIYDPVLGIRQPRFEIFVNRTTMWNGTPTAFGFIVQDNGLIDNFEYSVDNFRRFFDFDWQPATGIQGELAQHVIGFQERSWMADLLLDTNIEFDFYRGFIGQKGTEQAFTNILRSDFITKTAGFSILEEWAFQIGEYGNTERKSGLELEVIQSQFTTDPQIIEFVNTSSGDPSYIDITPNDSRWVLKNSKNNTNNQFYFRGFKNIYRQDLPNAGYVRVDETTYNMLNEASFATLFDTVVPTNESTFNDGDTIWTTIRANGGWTVYRVCKDQQLASIQQGSNPGDPTVFQTTSNHSLNSGDIIFFQVTTSTSPDLIGMQTVLDTPTSNTFRISDSIGTGITYSGNGPNVYALKPVRFANEAARNSFTPAMGWLINDLTWIDDNGNNLWEVQKYNGSAWTTVRTQIDKIDIDRIYNSVVYDSITNKDVIEVELYDPYKGLIFSAAEAEIFYQVDYDPAKYNSGDATLYQIDPDQAWGANQKGRLWWDLSTARFLDYEQGDINYSRKYWGQLAPNTSVNVYEWVQSPVPPSGWDAYVLAQGDSGTNRPTGSLPLEDNTPYVQIEVFNQAKNILETVYYFWALLPNTIPDGLPFRTLDALSVSQLISKPNTQSIAWIAPISQNAFIVNNLDTFINNSSSVLQITFYTMEKDSIINKQWILLRENDDISPPYQPLWNKMRDSLVGYDDLNLSVPDQSLSYVVKYGNNFRPRQTWFVDMYEARLEFFEKINSMLSSVNVTNIVGFDTQLNTQDPQPAVTDYDYSVATRADRDLLDNTILVGKKVLVQHDELSNNLWTLWQYAGGSSWTLLQTQLYNAADYWYMIDWYASGYSSSTTWNFDFPDIATMNANVTSFTAGDIIRVDNSGTGSWALYVYDPTANPIFQIVAAQNGTIQFRLSIANFDTTNSYLVDQTAAVTKIFVAALQDNILTIQQQNQIFIATVRYVYAEQTIVPWAFKTSLVYGQGQQIPLTQEFIQSQNLTNDLVNYFDEAKPYHTKLRTLTEQRRTQTDIANVQVTDTRIMHINFILDRVTQFTNIPDGANPKNYNVSTLNAADRIQLFYAPTEGMPPKILEHLISRSEFGGTILDGKSFYQFGTLVAAGYDNAPFDINLPQSGFDLDTANILGSVVNPTFLFGDQLIINGIIVTLTGTTLNDLVLDINSNSFLQEIGVTAGEVSVIQPTTGKVLQLFTTNGTDLALSGTARIKAGLPSVVNASNLTPSDLENYYDVFINGGGPLDTASGFAGTPQNGSTINIDGNQFIQPYLDADHPEELTKIRCGDSLIIDVYTKVNPSNILSGFDNGPYDEAGFDADPNDVPLSAIRSPKIVVKKIQGTVAGITGPFSIGQTPQSKQSLFVMKNGTMLKLNTDYTVDWNLLTVTLINPIFVADTVIINSFGPGGGIIVKKKVFHNSSSLTYDMKTIQAIPDAGTVFASVDGDIAAVSVSGSIVTILNPIPSNSTVFIVVFSNDDYSVIHTQTTAGGTNPIVLTYPAGLTLPPYIATHVFKNGLRLTPPTMKLYDEDISDAYYQLTTTPSAPQFVRVWQNGTELTPGTQFARFFLSGATIINGGAGYSVGDPIVVTGTGTGASGFVSQVDGTGKILGVLYENFVNSDPTPGTDYTGTPTLSVTSSGAGANLVAQVTTDMILLLGTQIQGAQLLVLDEENGDYSLSGINSDQLTIPGSLGSDSISITTYTDDVSFGMMTEVYTGSALSTYPIGGVPTDKNSLLVYVDGELKSIGQDYDVVIDEAGLDNPFDGYGVEYDGGDNLSVKFPPGTHSDTDKIVITYFELPPEEEGTGLRIFKNIFGNFEYLRISNANSTTLAAPLLSTDKIVTVTDATVLGQPDIAAQTPGVIFVNGERITFWAVSGNQLLQCMRGTQGTGINLDLDAGVVVRDASKNQEIPGGYNWEFTPNGSLYSTSEQYTFLEDSPGTIDFNNP